MSARNIVWSQLAGQFARFTNTCWMSKTVRRSIAAHLWATRLQQTDVVDTEFRRLSLQCTGRCVQRGEFEQMTTIEMTSSTICVYKWRTRCVGTSGERHIRKRNGCKFTRFRLHLNNFVHRPDSFAYESFVLALLLRFLCCLLSTEFLWWAFLWIFQWNCHQTSTFKWIVALALSTRTSWSL